MIEWQPIIEAGAKALIPKLFEKALSTSTKGFREKIPYQKMTFESHFEYAFKRCTLVKTIVNGDSPIKLLENYVNPNFKHKNQNIDEYAFIDAIFNYKKVVLIGSAGSGKSMFMRYLWISCFVEPRGKIPIYIELRKYNEITHNDFMGYVFHSSVDRQEDETRNLFDRAVKEGQFIFILDGYDEIKKSKKAECEQAIIALSQSENVIVVSGRPDDNYISWQNLLLYEMMPLSLQQTVKLIDNIDFDKTVKKKFIAQLKKNLYETHKDLASRPLLATMMLLTFSSFADIPEKIHVFYDQAFDTLFSRHDATKEAFKRDRKTDYSIDVFKRYFSLFCLLTYNEAKNDFTEAQILENLRIVAKLENEEIRIDELKQDIIDSVCLLQKDGLKYVFSHRSFQEYFTAYSLARLPEKKVTDLLKRFASRISDNVIPMLFDMNKNLVERAYLSDSLKTYVEHINHEATKEFYILSYLAKIDISLFIQYTSELSGSNLVILLLPQSDNEFYTIRENTLRLYPELRKSNGLSIWSQIPSTLSSQRDANSFKEHFVPHIISLMDTSSCSIIYRQGALEMSRAAKKGRNLKRGIQTITSSARTNAFETWIKSSDFSHFLEKEHLSLELLSKEMATQMLNREKTMEEILGL